MLDRSSKPATAPTKTEPKTLTPNAVTHLTQCELARRWRMSERTLERWRYQQIGPRYLKIVGHVIYSVDDVEAYEARQKRG
jgi:hypothetical protein